MTTEILDWNKIAIPGLKPVREDRRTIWLPIEICGFDRWGRFFTERTTTLNVCESGCKFSLRTETSISAPFAIRMGNDCKSGEKPSHSVLFRIVRLEKFSGGWLVAASKLQHDECWIKNLAGIPNQQSRKFD
jgi:hypothetical protein